MTNIFSILTKFDTNFDAEPPEAVTFATWKKHQQTSAKKKSIRAKHKTTQQASHNHWGLSISGAMCRRWRRQHRCDTIKAAVSWEVHYIIERLNDEGWFEPSMTVVGILMAKWRWWLMKNLHLEVLKDDCDFWCFFFRMTKVNLQTCLQHVIQDTHQHVCSTLPRHKPASSKHSLSCPSTNQVFIKFSRMLLLLLPVSRDNYSVAQHETSLVESTPFS